MRYIVVGIIVGLLACGREVSKNYSSDECRGRLGACAPAGSASEEEDDEEDEPEIVIVLGSPSPSPSPTPKPSPCKKKEHKKCKHGKK